MYKKILIFTIFLFLSAFLVNAKSIDGDPCLNYYDCESDVCQGGICQPADIRGLFPAAPTTPSTPSTPSYRGGADYCVENWDCEKYTACVLGKQTRTCRDLNTCNNAMPYYDKPAEEIACTITAGTAATCYDGFQNQGEEGPDCGGPCSTCETCDDGFRNQLEEGVDCGGPCMPCKGAVPMIVMIIAGVLVAILLVLGFWYWKLKKGAKQVVEEIKRFKPQPPTQPSSMLRI